VIKAVLSISAPEHFEEANLNICHRWETCVERRLFPPTEIYSILLNCTNVTQGPKAVSATGWSSSNSISQLVYLLNCSANLFAGAVQRIVVKVLRFLLFCLCPQFLQRSLKFLIFAQAHRVPRVPPWMRVTQQWKLTGSYNFKQKCCSRDWKLLETLSWRMND
jgi:hypothetical protein